MKALVVPRLLRALLALSAALTLAYPLAAAEEPPQVSKDGLQLKSHTKQRIVYVRPGATFNQFNRVMILD